MKQLPEFAPYREGERRLQDAVAVGSDFHGPNRASVTEADNTTYWIEAYSLLGSVPAEAVRETRPPFEIADTVLPLEAEKLFLPRFKKLTA